MTHTMHTFESVPLATFTGCMASYQSDLGADEKDQLAAVSNANGYLRIRRPKCFAFGVQRTARYLQYGLHRQVALLHECHSTPY